MESPDKGRAKRVEEILIESELSLRQFADKINVSPSSVSRVVKGDLPVSSGLALKIEKALGYCAEYILNGTPPKKHAAFAQIDPAEQMLLGLLRELRPDGQRELLRNALLAYLDQDKAMKLLYPMKSQDRERRREQITKMMEERALFLQGVEKHRKGWHLYNTRIEVLMEIYFRDQCQSASRSKYSSVYPGEAKGDSKKYILEIVKRFSAIQSKLDKLWDVSDIVLRLEETETIKKDNGL